MQHGIVLPAQGAVPPIASGSGVPSVRTPACSAEQAGLSASHSAGPPLWAHSEPHHVLSSSSSVSTECSSTLRPHSHSHSTRGAPAAPPEGTLTPAPQQQPQQQQPAPRISWATSWLCWAPPDEQRYLQWKHEQYLGYDRCFASFLLLHMVVMLGSLLATRDPIGTALSIQVLLVKLLPYWPLLLGWQQCFIR